MKRMKKLLSIGLVGLMMSNLLSLTVYAEDEITVSAEGLKPGYNISAYQNDALAENVVWEYYTGSEWQTITDMTTNPARIPLSAAEKSIRANVSGIYSDEKAIGANSVSHYQKYMTLEDRETYEDKDIQPTQPPANTFKIADDADDEKTYIILAQNGEQYFVMAPSLGAGMFADARGKKADPTAKDNVVGFLNLAAINGNNSATDSAYSYLTADAINQDIAAYIDRTHVWFTESSFEREGTSPNYTYPANDDAYTFTAGVSIISYEEFLSCKAKLGQDTIIGGFLRTPAYQTGSLTYFNNTLVRNTTTNSSTLRDIRPVFYIDKTFFSKVALDVTMGSEVLNIVKSMPLAELRLLYNEYQLADWGLIAPPQPPVASNVEISYSKAYPGYTLAADWDYSDPNGIEQGNSIVEWYSSVSESGPYTKIDGAVGKEWVIPNGVARKWVKPYVYAKNADGSTALAGVPSAAAVQVGEALPEVVGFSPAASNDGEAEDYAFYYNGKRYQMLDYEVNNGVATFFILSQEHISQSKMDVDNTNFFNVNDPDRNSIAYWLNHELLKKATPDTTTYKIVGGTIPLYNFAGSMEEAMRVNIDAEHEWRTERGPANSDVERNDYVFKAGISLLSVDEYIRYIDRVSYNNINGYFLRTSSPGNINAFCAVNKGDALGSVNLSYGSTGIFLIKPAFYLKKDFFINNRVDPLTMGTEVKRMLVANISRAELQSGRAGYSTADLVAIGYPSALGYAENVTISGLMAVGGTVEAQYDFNENGTGNGEGSREAMYQWYRADSANGTYAAIEGATSKTYTLAAADNGKYIKVEVTPYDVNNVICTMGSGAAGVPVRAEQNVTAGNGDINETGIPSATARIKSIPSSKEVVMIISEFDTDGRLVQMTKENKSLTQGTDDYSVSLTGVKGNPTNIINVMILDSIDNMKPIYVFSTDN